MSFSSEERTKYFKDNFKKIYQSLNDEQRIAVDTIEGTVMVMAGPGTGKTHILATRIGKILLETDAYPNNILCLTFTEAGVRAMRQRLLQLIGPDAYRVHIFTFHSFCNYVIQDNADTFDSSEKEPVNELEKMKFLRACIDELPAESILKQNKTNPYFYEKKVLHLLEDMKKEAWSAAYINAICEQWQVEMLDLEEYKYQRNSGTFSKGDLKISLIEKEKKSLQLLAAAANLYENYQAKLNQSGRYDFDDMILWVNDAFAKNQMLLRRYQEQYLYILVDEFQDTNGAQSDLIRHLVSYWDEPNLFIVGDDDQAIYEFQGARLRNIIDIYEKYRSYLQLVVLKDNYRSSQLILDNARFVINNNTNRLITLLSKDIYLDKNLVAKGDFKALDLLPEIRCYDNVLSETIDTIEQIKSLHSSGTALEEIAIIFSKNKQSDILVELLQKNDIPYNIKNKPNILITPIIKRLLMWLEYLSKEIEHPFTADYLLYQLMYFDTSNLATIDIAKLGYFIQNAETKTSWRLAISDKTLLQDANILSIDSFLHYSIIVESLIKIAANSSAFQCITEIVANTGLLQKAKDDEHRIDSFQYLYSFLDFVKQESTRHTSYRIKDLLVSINILKETNLKIPVSQDVGMANGVNLLTAHGSKGLEFEYVFIFGSIEKNWFSKDHANFRFKMPPNLQGNISSEIDEEEAKRRTFYVAMTRAKKKLTISYSLSEKSNPVHFIHEITEKEPEIAPKSIKITPSAYLDSGFALLDKTKIDDATPIIDGKLWADYFNRLILSPSGLNNYIKCPLSFYYIHILRVPQMTSLEGIYGQIIHKTLEKYHHFMMKKRTEESSLEKLLGIFDTELSSVQFILDKNVIIQFKKTAHQNLTLFYQTEYSRPSVKSVAEVKYHAVEWNGVPMTGVIDRIDPTINHYNVNIIDYKTSKFSLSKSKLHSPSEKNDFLGGEYWRQMAFYQLLFEQDLKRHEHPISAQIIWMQAENDKLPTPSSITLDHNSSTAIQRIISKVWENIKSKKFNGCGSPQCKWCQMNNQSFKMNIISEADIDYLDDNIV
ncbi:MAG: ATP-dependent helicase [Saprospiraceae bacterium]|nr:ATP-dependent helicase [Saprospiraceae bacterium]